MLRANVVFPTISRSQHPTVVIICSLHCYAVTLLGLCQS